MAESRKISKAKGVEICADRLFAGIKSKEIVREMTEKYGVSISAVEKWMKAARPAVAERQAAIKTEKDRIDKAEAEASAKGHNLTRGALMERLGQIIYAGQKKVKAIQVTEGGDMKVELEDVEEEMYVRTADVLKAIEIVNKMQGYNAPDKADITSGGEKIGPTVIKWGNKEIRV